MVRSIHTRRRRHALADPRPAGIQPAEAKQPSIKHDEQAQNAEWTIGS
jgi:hypothetical protein